MKCRIDTRLREFEEVALELEQELSSDQLLPDLESNMTLTAKITQHTSDPLRAILNVHLLMERGAIEKEITFEKNADLKKYFANFLRDEIENFRFHNQGQIFHLGELSENDLFNQIATTQKDLNIPRKTVLVVDDDPIAAATLKTLIQSYGAQVVSVNTTLEAEQMLSRAKYKFDLMILDWYLPRETGIDFLQRIDSTTTKDRRDESKPPSSRVNLTPVIMCSSRDPQYFSMPKLRSFCITSYWFKGESFSSICSEIEKALQQ